MMNLVGIFSLFLHLFPVVSLAEQKFGLEIIVVQTLDLYRELLT